VHVELWQGVEFKIGEAQFFFDKMGKILIPPDRHPAYGVTAARWQPDFYYYLDAFLGATRSIPDVIQKCFGWDDKSAKVWPTALDAQEIDRRKAFQAELRDLYRAFADLPLSRVRTGTFHWVGLPSVQTKAKVFGGQEYTGRPGEVIPAVVPKQFPEGTDPSLVVLFGKSRPVEPSWQDFVVELPREDGGVDTMPLFETCRAYLDSARRLADNASEIAIRVHKDESVTVPPAVQRERPS
jgi:hypothetical protein